jgi:hypothetical protein
VAEESVVEKRNKKGSRREQEARGNDFSMEQRCLLRNIHFWPMAVEADGAMSKSFISFFNLVCDAANDLTGQKPRGLPKLLVEAPVLQISSTELGGFAHGRWKDPQKTASCSGS